MTDMPARSARLVNSARSSGATRIVREAERGTSPFGGLPRPRFAGSGVVAFVFVELEVTI